MVGADKVPPGLQPTGNALDHPELHFWGRLAGQAKGGGAPLVLGHALGGQFVPAQQPVDQLAGIAVVKEGAVGAARLVVDHQDVGAFADRFHVAQALALVLEIARIHPQPETIMAAHRLRHPIVAIPDG